MKGGIERPLPDGQRGSRDLCEALRDGPPVPWLQGQRLENQKVERSLRKTSVRNWRHGTTSFALRQEASASHVEVQGEGYGFANARRNQGGFSRDLYERARAHQEFDVLDIRYASDDFEVPGALSCHDRARSTPRLRYGRS